MKTVYNSRCLTLATLPMLMLVHALTLAPIPAAAVTTTTTQTRKSSRSSATNNAASLATLTGLVRDGNGAPLEGVLISLLRRGWQFNGTRLVKETRSRADGTFAISAAAGQYEVQAQANGFAAASVSDVELNARQDFAVRFNLVRAGSGRTTPEQRADRNDPKWRIRAAQSNRSIFQVDETAETVVVNGELASSKAGESVDEVETNGGAPGIAADDINIDNQIALDEPPPESKKAKKRPSPRGVIETYYAASANPFAPVSRGTNIALSVPFNARTSFTLSSQIGSQLSRFDIASRTRVNNQHHVRLRFGVARLEHEPTLLPSLINDENNETTATASLARAAFDSGFTNSSARLAVDFAPHNFTHHQPATTFARNLNLAQISVRATDEWIVRDGIVVVYGVDYTQFLEGSARSAAARRISPRLGLRFDANARTTIRAAYTESDNAGNDAAQSTAAFENDVVLFKETAAPAYLTSERGAPQLERTGRLEFGIERVLDSRSRAQATAFLDATQNRGVGLSAFPINDSRGATGNDFAQIIEQQGATRGVRLLFTRRLNKTFSFAAGYSFGQGQRLDAGLNKADETSETAAANDNEAAAAAAAPVSSASSRSSSPLTGRAFADGNFFSNSFFQTFATQVDADLTDSTNVRAVVRFSPRATVFAIDPFAGELAVYDPSLSVIVTQELPTFGLPVRARATIDARNLFDLTTAASSSDGEASLLLGSLRRTVRGGIAVRF